MLRAIIAPRAIFEEPNQCALLEPGDAATAAAVGDQLSTMDEGADAAGGEAEEVGRLVKVEEEVFVPRRYAR